MKIKADELTINKTKVVHNHFYPICSGPQPSDPEFIIQVDGIEIKGKNMKFIVKSMMMVIIAIASAFDSAGNAIDITALGALNWQSSDPSIATVGTNDAGQTVVIPTGKAGTVQISVTGDSDPNTPEGFAGMVELTFLPGEVTTVALSVETNDAVQQTV